VNLKFNLERNKSDPTSNIKADLSSMTSAAVTGSDAGHN